MSPETEHNRENRRAHARILTRQFRDLQHVFEERFQRRGEQAPPLPPGIPILLKIDPDLELDKLRASLGFEIVSEEDDGFVIVATKELNPRELLEKIEGFTSNTWGTAAVASIHSIESEDERLKRILSPLIFSSWSRIQDRRAYIVDVSIGNLGDVGVPHLQNRRADETDAQWESRCQRYHERFVDAQLRWDELKLERETWLMDFVQGYGGTILRITEDAPSATFNLPDSFSSRISISGQGLRDLVLNTSFIFEVSEPEEIEVLITAGFDTAAHPPGIDLVPPSPDDPAVCVIDSGIQETHPYLAPAIDTANSLSFVDETAPQDVADYVPGGGHGTRVAGAVLYSDGIPRAGEYQLPCRIQNVRVLDHTKSFPPHLFPPKLLEQIIREYHGNHGTKIFNHSIAARHACRTRHMSIWAAAIDELTWTFDILLLQAAGNIPESSGRRTGILEHLAEGRTYPDYLLRKSSRVSSPAQALHALTVGSVGLDSWTNGTHTSFVQVAQGPSAFTRTGLGIWETIKPDVVEFGGDYASDNANPPLLVLAQEICPELTRSTLASPGPLTDRDAVGTSFACPKVAALAVEIQKVFPDAPALLYRALIAQSARWPEWTRNHTAEEGLGLLRYFGYGIPSQSRATIGSDYRITLITEQTKAIKARETHVYQIPIPDVMRAPENDQDIRIEVTLAYVASPRRTRRHLRRYLSTWLDWKSSRFNEDPGVFAQRVMKVGRPPVHGNNQDSFPWALHAGDDWGTIQGVRRSNGSLQKDWCYVKAHQLPEHFSIAVVGHQGWSSDPNDVARYSLVVSFESINNDLEVYNPIRLAIEELEVTIPPLNVPTT